MDIATLDTSLQDPHTRSQISIKNRTFPSNRVPVGARSLYQLDVTPTGSRPRRQRRRRHWFKQHDGTEKQIKLVRGQHRQDLYAQFPEYFENDGA